MIRPIQYITNVRYISSATTAVTRIHRTCYARQYPVSVVQSDGSSITIRYQEPRKIIKLPLDLSTLTEVEKKARLDARKPRKLIKIEDEVEDNFNSKKYLKFLKKN
ncbi:MRPL55 family protein [Megaselia abdita]